MRVFSKSTAKKRTATKKSSKKIPLLSRFQGLSKKGQLLAFCLIFAVVGGSYYLYQSRASDGIPDKANQLIASYDIGMIHSYYPDDFTAGMPSAMVLYGNGLMLCNQDSLAAADMQHEMVTPANNDNWQQRQLTREQVLALITKLRASGFDKAAIYERSPDQSLPPLSSGRFIRINTDTGVEKASTYPGDPDTGFVSAENVLKAECAQATTAYETDDISVESITLPKDSPDAAQATTELPAGVDSDPTPNQGKTKELKGKAAKALKANMTKESKVYKKGDTVVRARYVKQIPSYDEPLPKKVSNKGKVSAAADYKVRFLIVLAAGQSTPSWATGSTVSGDATAVRNYYNNKLGKTFDAPAIAVVRSSKTAGELRTCPAGANCGSTSTLRWYRMNATYYNLDREFHLPGYSTVMFTAFDATYVSGSSALCAGLGAQPDNPDGTMTANHYPYVSTVGVSAVINAGGDAGTCNTYAERRMVAAHEFGHNTSLWHISDGSLMNPTANPANWPGVALNATQANILKTSSLFFNSTVAPTPTPPPPPAPTCPSTMGVGAVLGTGQTLKSPDCGIRLVMQTDGNLVVYSRLGHAIWASGSRGSNARFALQTDYNLVVRNGAGTAIWASGTKGSGGTQLRVQNDGNVVLYSSGGAVWSTHTAGDYNK
jgi:hypothetical protein